ncbi:MAG: TIR domain-containing protein [Gammaproteobacteria bacterium]|nr:TIR domain-containing protein [Gammaproteobacteria bacterium]
MTDEDTIKLYATHLWRLDDEYLRLFDYLGDVENFYYVNLSKPEEEPVGDALAARDSLLDQIQGAELVIVLSSQYNENPDLIDLQLTTAKRHGKPILAVEAFGPDPVPEKIQSAADHVVEWYARNIVDAIKMLTRGEEISRFDTIEWPGDL